jgi:hypothetical protein
VASRRSFRCGGPVTFNLPGIVLVKRPLKRPIVKSWRVSKVAVGHVIIHYRNVLFVSSILWLLSPAACSIDQGSCCGLVFIYLPYTFGID